MKNLRLLTKKEEILIRHCWSNEGCIHKVLDQSIPYSAKEKVGHIYHCDRR